MHLHPAACDMKRHQWRIGSEVRKKQQMRRIYFAVFRKFVLSLSASTMNITTMNLKKCFLMLVASLLVLCMPLAIGIARRKEIALLADEESGHGVAVASDEGVS